MDEVKTNEITYKKIDLQWYCALQYLRGLKNIGNVIKDENFLNMYNEMLWYVIQKIDFPEEKVISKYIVMESYKK